MANIADKKTTGIILIITDGGYNESSYQTLSFKNKKIKVHTFKNASDAVKDCKIDIILLDCTVDIEEGLKILRNNKSICPRIPNIFITDISHEGLVLKVFRSGARDFFRKPVNISELKNTVEGIIHIKKNSKEMRCPFLKASNYS